MCVSTIKLVDKEQFDEKQIGVKEPFHIQWPIANLHHKDKEHLALRNNFRVTKKFLITKSHLAWADFEIKVE